MGRSIALAALAFLAMVGLVELAVRALDLFDSERRAVTLAMQGGDSEDSNEPLASAVSPTVGGVLHPYLGFSQRTGVVIADQAALAAIFRDSPYGRPRWNVLKANVQGFVSPIDDYRTVDPAKTTIAVFGGSVAEAFASVASAVFKTDFARPLGIDEESVEILNFGKGGYKQPQPTIALLQALLSGIDLDVVVEIDGFNEAAMGGMDCAGDYDPLFPSANHYLSLLGVVVRDASTQALEAAVAIRRLRERSRNLRASLRANPLRGLETVKALYGVLSARAERAAVMIESDAQNDAARGLGRTLPVANLARTRDAPGTSCEKTIADLWVGSSLAMATLARERRIPYVHVLQPNQYVGDTKPLSDEERATAWQPDGRWARAAAAGYPFLRARSAELLAAGVEFHDLTQLFAGHTETLYVDPCCHYNLRGNQLLVQAIAPLVAHGLRSR
jgi:hypothetical protein